ncbi:MAG TPA: primosomal protein N', partial [Trueperaceae bacterium]
GEPKVLVATYLGLLAPLPELARVVVLEEAANSYKLPSGARLFIPTVARLLAETHGVPLVLADALPNPESRWRLPPEACIDLGASDARLHVTDLTQASNWPVAGDLIRVLRQVQDRERQAVVLASRRGFSAALSCSECHWLAMCPNCDLPLRYNQERYRLRCHQCGHSETAPRACPSCRSHHLLPSRAAGTQWVAREISKLLPGFCVRRYDGDRRDDLSGLLAGEPGIVVGTSAILRHPPLPKVSLVAVTLLDTALNLSDFRAEEEAYRLLSNLAELAPASRPLTVVQTFQPDHPVLEAFAGGDAAAFVQSLLARRERFGYPPFSAMAKVQISARQRSTAQNAAAWLARAISTAGAATRELLGPAPAPVARIRNQYSFQLFVRAADHARLQLLLQPALAYHGTARVRVEVDPRDVSEFLE